MRQTSIQIHSEDGGIAVHGFSESITQGVVGVGDIIPLSAEGLQAIGGIVGIRVRTSIEQIAIVVPGIGHTVETGQPVGIVILISDV